MRRKSIYLDLSYLNINRPIHLYHRTVVFIIDFIVNHVIFLSLFSMNERRKRECFVMLILHLVYSVWEKTRAMASRSLLKLAGMMDGTVNKAITQSTGCIHDMHF